jgi:hypothetical protein
MHTHTHTHTHTCTTRTHTHTHTHTSPGLITLDELPKDTLEFDTDSDGQVSQEEVEDVLDADGDGAVNETENNVDFETFKTKLYADVQPKFETSHPQFVDVKPP